MAQAGYNPPGAPHQGWTGAVSEAATKDAFAALHSGNSGINRPSYMTEGGTWSRINTDGSISIMAVKDSDGSLTDIEVWRGDANSIYTPPLIGTLLPYTFADEPTGYAFCVGQELTRAAYPKLWNKINATASVVVADSEWGGTNIYKFSYGDGTSTFRMPDLRNAHIRGAGDMFALGEYIGDAIRNIQGSFAAYTYTLGIPTGSFTSYLQTGEALSGGAGGTSRNYVNFNFNASRVVPTASENRVLAAAYNFIMRVV